MATAIITKVEERLDDIGLGERASGAEIRAAARAYYLNPIDHGRLSTNRHTFA